ncbi:methyltransferase-like protein 17, mitochondrial [Trichonephila clavipes]|nr:methyltransferase-like protein 17, mitochondrial [Trichonephila clavipes]
MHPFNTAVFSFGANKVKILNAVVKTLICYSNKHCFSSKSSIEILPEIRRLLDSNDMKHRKHPGVRKIPPIQLPKLLISSIYKLISNGNEKNILIAAKELNNFLVSRRLPLEQNEKKWRIEKILKSNDNNCDFNEVTEEQMKKAQRQIKNELRRWKPLEYGHFECLAYMAARMPANYASIFKIFSEIKFQLPEYEPKTFFDFGSGVGSAVWAAQAVWNESLSEYFCVDSSSYMNDVAETLLTDEKSGDKYVKNIFFRQFLPASEDVS